MGRAILREKDVEFDIESGENTSEDDTSNDERDSMNGFPWSLNSVLNLDGSEKGKIGIESCSSSSNSCDALGVDDCSLELLVDNKGLEHVNGKQKIKFTNPRKPQKPPLPPKGPSLDAGDHKYMKELADLALRKRARIKKMKEVQKMKASKSSPSSTYTSLSAMVITVFFLLVIILHAKDLVMFFQCVGKCPILVATIPKTLFAGIRSSSTTAVGLTVSPETAVVADKGLISVQFPTSFNTSGRDEPGSHFPSLQEG
ncbi:hypothetical protein TSUD_38740 [Trifolium subterraneum]|uniref:Transmembrane protein n=1 Tax=Trifolium subterraneum TaxID=3900 RepID=A0A2Z6MWZ9_TRISU|nr:hypothetical protein TSUD_38740 [Trifolium subterraneum]